MMTGFRNQSRPERNLNFLEKSIITRTHLEDFTHNIRLANISVMETSKGFGIEIIGFEELTSGNGTYFVINSDIPDALIYPFNAEDSSMAELIEARTLYEFERKSGGSDGIGLHEIIPLNRRYKAHELKVLADELNLVLHSKLTHILESDPSKALAGLLRLREAHELLDIEP